MSFPITNCHDNLKRLSLNWIKHPSYYIKSNHIQHNPHRCHSTNIASHYFHFNLSIYFQPYYSLTYKKSQMLSTIGAKAISNQWPPLYALPIQSTSTVVPNNPYHQSNPSSIMDQVQSHPAYPTKCPNHPIPFNSCSKQSISSKQPQLYHGPSPITSSIILIGVTAPLLQATISISISQFISNPIILWLSRSLKCFPPICANAIPYQCPPL